MKLIKAPRLNDELELIPFNTENDKRHINYFGEVQAGFPSPAEDFIGKKISLDEKYITKPNSTYIIKIRGNSMNPTLQNGDIVIVRSDKELQDNDIAIVSINNSDYTVKRFDKKNSQFVPDNPKFKAIEVEEEDVVICLGIVKHLIRDF
jgi:DNA polymerase V